MSLVWFDGAVRPAADCTPSLWNHSLHYGYGVFEGLRAYDWSGHPTIFRLDEHVERLYRSAELIELEVPYPAAIVRAALSETLAANNLKAAYLRPIVFLGDGLDGLKEVNVATHMAVLAWAWDRPLAADDPGVNLTVAGMRRPRADSFPLQAKATGGYLTSKIAYLRALKAGFDDAILLDSEGLVSETTAQNLFAVFGDVLVTPPADNCLPGITRATVLEFAGSLNLTAIEEGLPPQTLATADEIFLTSTASEVRPVSRIDATVLPGPTPGPVTRSVAKAYHDLVAGFRVQPSNRPSHV